MPEKMHSSFTLPQSDMNGFNGEDIPLCLLHCVKSIPSARGNRHAEMYSFIDPVNSKKGGYPS